MDWFRTSLLLIGLQAFIGSPSFAQDTSKDEPLIEADLRHLLTKSRALQAASVALLQNIYSSENSLLFPETDIVVIMLRQDIGAHLLLERFELIIDGEPVQMQRYNSRDMEILMNRGQQTMFTALLPAGPHRIDARLFGLGLDRAGIKGEVFFEKESRPHFIELVISGGHLALEEWN